eukprot:COSAG01_NODE_14389_length_1460_cov_6.049229_1_plen_165_part_00
MRIFICNIGLAPRHAPPYGYDNRFDARLLNRLTAGGGKGLHLSIGQCPVAGSLLVEPWIASRMCGVVNSWVILDVIRGPGLANRLQTAIFGDLSGICKTRIQQQQTAAAEFGTFLLKNAMAHTAVWRSGIDHPKTATSPNLRSHSIDKLSHYDIRPAHPASCCC